MRHLNHPEAQVRARPPRLGRVVTASIAAAVLVGWVSLASAAERMALFRLDSLGVPAQLVSRLEGLLRMEVSRLGATALPDPSAIERLLERHPELRGCTGADDCLAQIGRLLGVDAVVSGNVGGLADSFVVNLKLVDVRRAREVRRIQETMSGRADQLIEAVRVAAYRLVAPERLRGALNVQVTVTGADVYLDGRWLGKSPVPVQRGLPLGEYALRVSKAGYDDALQPVRVPFQKTAEVVVRLQTPARAPIDEQVLARSNRPVPWYTRWWFWTAVGVAGAGVGLALGLGLAGTPGINCNADPARCGL